jgi:hypothetical protein
MAEDVVGAEYYQKRLEASLAAAKAAQEPGARIAHEGLAKAYRKKLDRLRASIKLNEL